MSQAKGKQHFQCDRCGKDVGNGNIFGCAVVSRIDLSGMVVNYHLCEDVKENGEITQYGCATAVLSGDNLAAYTNDYGDPAEHRKLAGKVEDAPTPAKPKVKPKPKAKPTATDNEEEQK